MHKTDAIPTSYSFGMHHHHPGVVSNIAIPHRCSHATLDGMDHPRNARAAWMLQARLLVP
jgi:hypothetical protein